MDLAGLLGDILLRLGRWDEADRATREGLALDQLDQGTIYLAAVRSRLLALRGNADEANERLARIDRTSLDPDVAAFVAAVRAETALTAGQPAEASAAVAEGLARLEGLEEMVWAAPLIGLGFMALAEAAEDARTARASGADPELEATVLDMSRRTERLSERAATPSARAWVALARAEAVRFDGRPEAESWLLAVQAWEAVPDPYQAAYCRFRSAEAALRVAGLRANAAEPLRAAHAVAVGLGAAPLRKHIEALAGRGRVDLSVTPAAPAGPPAEDAGGGVAVGPGRARAAERRHRLSERELEVLVLVAAGRTNGEIAERLFITRKTAAVHVTHILDKLGVSNRVEAAMVAARLGIADGTGDA
jgi:DNA-binding CsgD family transcriptional regulator